MEVGNGFGLPAELKIQLNFNWWGDLGGRAIFRVSDFIEVELKVTN